MRIFLYEFVTGGGWSSREPDPPPASLVAEGHAMATALAADFCAMGATVDLLADASLHGAMPAEYALHEVQSAADERDHFDRLAANADWTIVIAPEFEGYLHDRCRRVEELGGRLLGPSSAVVALAADKHAMAEHLARHGVRVPRGIALEPDEPLPRVFEYPAVLKPLDGAGSLGIELMAEWSPGRRNGSRASRLEVCVPGRAASVSFLCGPRSIVPLAPCWQRLSDDGRFAYQGGSLPIHDDFARRAVEIATRAIASLPRPLGYLGVDLVAGHDRAGLGDTVIEINPRLTTSYVGLRALCQTNLAQAMIEIASGRDVELCWHERSLQFDSAGNLEQGQRKLDV